MKPFCPFALILSLFFCLPLVASAQNDATGNAGERYSMENAEMERPPMKDLVVEKKIAGRLPNGYRSVVTNEQRENIYKIQKEYAEIIERMKARIQLLEIERDKKVDALLSEEQTRKLKQVRGSLESEKHLLPKERPAARRGRRAAQPLPAAETETP